MNSSHSTFRTYAVGVTFLSAALLTSCSSDSKGNDVPWQDYDPSVQTRIDDLEAAKDCTGLQAEFDQADANGPATEARTGHNNADLMAYIDAALSDAGCYGS